MSTEIATEKFNSDQLLKALKLMANGDFSCRLPQDQGGISQEIAEAFNKCAELNEQLAIELAKTARLVGKEGQSKHKAELKGAEGSWAASLDSLNTLTSDMLRSTAEVNRVIGAVAKGDLNQSMELEIDGEPLKGAFLQKAKTVNTMVAQLNSFAYEFSRIAREVGNEGKLGGQAQVSSLSGTWKDLSDSLNSMTSNLTAQVRNIAEVTTAVANGDLSKKITVDVRGEFLELKNTTNTMVDQLGSFAAELTRVAREVGTDGKLGGQAHVRGVSGTWKDLTDSVNYMASNLTSQVRNIAEVTTAVANGDLSKKITVDVKGEILELKNTINTMVDQLSSFADEVTRVAREVGTEGKLGGQAVVKGVSGTWRDLTDSVNRMASNLTEQVRGIASIVSAVAQGNLKRKLVLQAKGEIALLQDTINEMIDTLDTFADQVSSVAREVGVEGVLGGQARVPGAAGTWKDLTSNVNGLADNLTTQVRAITEVATAVTKGDLTRSIDVDARGEVASLKDTINEMIRNLKDTTRRNMEQDWLKTNIARFTSMLQGQREMLTVANLILSELTPLVNAQAGAFYVCQRDKQQETVLRLIGTYACSKDQLAVKTFRLGEGLSGQCALEKRRILFKAPGDYLKISSGLGEASPANVVALPILFEDEVKAVIELASFADFSTIHLALLDQLRENIGIVLNTIEANMTTDNLLIQSQRLAQELQAQQEELQESNTRLEQQARTLQASEELLTEQQQELKHKNEELQDKAQLLAIQNAEVEEKNKEIEMARLSLLEKARQLTLSSKYKSEFLANMSHELRTPLNSLLILSKLLADNIEGNLSAKQVEFSQTIHDAGADLLALINDILDLSKIESGTITIEPSLIYIKDIADNIERNFRQLAETKKLDFSISSEECSENFINSDSKRLQQILKNLLSNAFKFTETGSVKVSFKTVEHGWLPGTATLDQAPCVIALTVSDTGIGIAQEKQQVIFEAFQQADGSTSRKYGGTGLGLPISREIAKLLGGQISVESNPGYGSSFTLYLPQTYLQLQVIESAAEKELSQPQLQTPKEAGQKDLQLPDLEKLKQKARAQDDRSEVNGNSKPAVLIVEADIEQAKMMLAEARNCGFLGIIAASGEEALDYCERHDLQAVLLALDLPDMTGWTVLDRLKHSLHTRHLPVYLVTASAKEKEIVEKGALGKTGNQNKEIHKALLELLRYIENPTRNLLLVEADKKTAQAIQELLQGPDIKIYSADSTSDAVKRLSKHHFNCVVLDSQMPQEEQNRLFKKLDSERASKTPFIFYDAPLSAGRTAIKKPAKAAQGNLILKKADSPESLLSQTALYLHRVNAQLPDEKRKLIEHASLFDSELKDHKILIVDDDLRNIFALTSILEAHGMKVVYAQNGKEAIRILEETKDIEIVLMDVMMPEMDGYDTSRKIRSMSKYTDLPIIALTAKAMKGDRDKCIEAGASDYISKPVETEQLKSLLRVWLSRPQ